MVKKSSKLSEGAKERKRQAKRYDKAAIHYTWTFGILIVTLCLAAFFPWPGFKVILTLATLWATFTPDGLNQENSDEAALSNLVFVVRTLALGVIALIAGSLKPVFFTYLGIGLVGLLLMSFCGYFLLQDEKHKNKLAATYTKAQLELSESPNDPMLRQAVLQAGRKYYAAFREDGLLTVYDETAINNDIQACLGDRSDTNK